MYQFHRISRPIVSSACLLVLSVLALLRPVLRIQLIIIGFHKYGHLALEPDLMLVQLDDAKRKKTKTFPISIPVWSLGPKRLRANSVLADLWKRRIFVAPSWLINGLVQVGKRFEFLSLEILSTSIHTPAHHHASSSGPLQLSKNQNQEGRMGLIEMGIDPNRPFICLIVRDSGHYSDPTGPENPAYEFRNYDIDDFSELAISLIKSGYQVVRMGAGKEKPFSLKHEGLFDYATSSFRSELLDVYLAANCSFAVSTQTGPDAVCLLFRRPVCYVEIPVFSQVFFGSGLAVWNPVIYEQNGQRLSLREIAKSDLLWVKTTEEILNLGIKGVRSTSAELVQNVESFVKYFESGCLLRPEEVERSVAANRILEDSLGERGKEVFGEVKASFNPAFLKRNAEWYLR